MVERKQDKLAAQKAAEPECAILRMVPVPNEIAEVAARLIREDQRPSGQRPTRADVYREMTLRGLARDEEAPEGRVFTHRNPFGLRQAKARVLFPAAEYEKIRAIATAENVDILDAIIWLMRLSIATPAPPL